MSEVINTVKGITLTPPVIGRITLGHTEMRGTGDSAKARPVKDDHFHITTLVQNKTDRSWGVHPLAKVVSEGQEKLRAIPVVIAYNDPNLSLSNHYSAFDMKTGRVLCAGNGITARRATTEGVQSIACPRPEACEHGVRLRCKSMTRAYLQIEGQTDELGVFALRTTSWNSLNHLATRLSQLSGLTGGKTAGMPMLLQMESKTSTQSYREPFQFADLVVRPGMTLLQAIKVAADYQDAMAAAGLSLEGMEDALRAGLANGDFADEIEDIDEFLSDEDLIAAAGLGSHATGLRGLDSLNDKLRSVSVADTTAPEESAAPENANLSLLEEAA